MRTYQKILIGIDFSDPSAVALKVGLRLGRLLQIPVTVSHIMDAFLAHELKRNFHSDDLQVKRDLEAKVRAFVEKNGDGDEVEIDVRLGGSAAGLSEICDELSAELLVLGIRGRRHALDQIGSTAAKCVRNAHADVLLVREDAKEAFGRVLACVDFSDASREAVTVAAQFAKLDAAAIDCLHVFQSPMMLAVDYTGYLPTLPMDDGSMLDDSQKRLHGFVEPLLADKEIEKRAVVVESASVVQTILAHVRQESVDLMVLGKHGHSKWHDLFLGSTAETILRHAPCSILAVKMEKVKAAY